METTDFLSQNVGPSSGTYFFAHHVWSIFQSVLLYYHCILMKDHCIHVEVRINICTLVDVWILSKFRVQTLVPVHLVCSTSDGHTFAIHSGGPPYCDVSPW